MKILGVGWNPEDMDQRLGVDVMPGPGDTDPVLVIDGRPAGGVFVPGFAGWLYQHTDGKWGYPAGWGVHVVEVQYRTVAAVDSPNVTAPVPPWQTHLVGHQLTPAEVCQPAYDAGFTSEDLLCAAVALAISESGLYSQARNWRPQAGFRPASDVIGVTGPATVWRSGAQGHSDRGLWQIASDAHPTVTDAQCDDPRQCARQAWTISAGGKNFGPWSTWGSGVAQSHIDRATQGWPAVRPIVQQFLAKL